MKNFASCVDYTWMSKIIFNEIVKEIFSEFSTDCILWRKCFKGKKSYEKGFESFNFFIDLKWRSTMYNCVFFVNIEQNVKIQGTTALFNPE